MRERGNVLNPELFGCFFPTAEKVDHVLCLHSDVIMSALTAKGKRYFSPAHSDDDYHCLMGVMNIVKDAREKKGYSQSELARLVGRSPSAINKIESGDTMSLKGITFLKLANTLGISPFAIMSIQPAVQTKGSSVAQEAADIIDSLSQESQERAIHHLRVFAEAEKMISDKQVVMKMMDDDQSLLDDR